MDFIVDPLYALIIGLATVVFALMACAAYLWRHPSAPFYTITCGALAFVFFVYLRGVRAEVLLICLLTVVVGFLIDRPEVRSGDIGEDSLTRRPR